jgi:hypothetical protein
MLTLLIELLVAQVVKNNAANRYKPLPLTGAYGNISALKIEHLVY